MKQKHNPKPREQQELALERIETLFREAGLVFGKDQALATRYITLAVKISTKYKVRIPRQLKKRFCKNCHSLLVPSVNCRVRLNQARVIYTCLNCGEHIRHPYTKELKEKRKKAAKSSL